MLNFMHSKAVICSLLLIQFVHIATQCECRRAYSVSCMEWNRVITRHSTDTYCVSIVAAGVADCGWHLLKLHDGV